MVNLAEEVKRPRRNVPIAILAGVVAVGAGYMLVTAAATTAVTPAALAASPSPLVEAVDRGFPWIPRPAFAVVALFAVANSALSGSLAALAGATSFILLAVFAAVDIALVRIHLRDPRPPQTFVAPLFVPILGAVASVV